MLREGLAAVDLTDPQSAEFAGIKRKAQALLRTAGGLLATGWAHAAADVLTGRPTCEPCNRPMATDRVGTIKKLSLVGVHTLTRAQYVCTHCGARARPSESAWKLGPGLLSPELSRVVSAAAVEIPSFERATATVSETLGVHLATSTVERTCEAIGAVAEAAIQAEMAEVLTRDDDACGIRADAPTARADTTAVVRALPDDAPTLLVGADGARVFEDKDWREVKIDVVCELGPERHHDPKTGRAAPVRRRGGGCRHLLCPSHHPSGSGARSGRWSGAHPHDRRRRPVDLGP